MDPATDLLQLKSEIRESYLLAHFASAEHLMIQKQHSSDLLIFSKHFSLMVKLIAISIDGFKSDRYQTKISDINETIDHVRSQLQSEEQQI